MLAIDTNVVVRYLTNDDPRQAAAARLVVEGHAVFVSDTVWLESDWVLRSVYDLDRIQVTKALRAFAGLAHVLVEDPVRLSQALDFAENGMDFSDALHLVHAQSTQPDACEAFLTFDRKLIRAGAKSATIAVRTP